MSRIQPAKISYFFSKGYTDLSNTIKGAFSRNLETVGMFKETIALNGITSAKGVVSMGAMICVLIFGTILTAAASVIHVAVLAFAFAAIYIMFGIVWLLDRIYILIHKISNACPNPECQEHFLIPAYACPECGRVHTRLMPGKYGILYRTCLCGNRMPTTFLNGRNKLETAFCPTCGYNLSGDTGSRQLAIPVIGGPDVGKTCLINMGVYNMMNKVAVQRGWEMEFMSELDKREYTSIIKRMDKGILPDKTDKDALTAYQISVRIPNDKVGRRLYIYDISGEMFSDSGLVQRSKAFGYADGFLFLIDPLTIPDYSMKIIDTVEPEKYGASSKDFDDIFDIMLNNLQVLFNLKPSDVLKRNLAVVITKMDIPGLEDEIGDTAAQDYMNHNPDCKSFEAAKNAVCERFLEENGEGNFVREAKSRFKGVRFFTASALGHNIEGKAFSSVDAEQPFMWIIEQVDPKMKTMSKAG